jgi:putative addiction module component (TIGR02574 family)
MAKLTLDDLLELSVDERLAIVEDLWDSLAADPAAVSVSGEQQRDLDKRLNEDEANPRAERPWPQVRAEILSELSKTSD